ncbi:MAG: uracil-DNA glycosylase family protein [Acidobacteriota bacterium]
MAERSTQPWNELLSYLRGLGYDSLYLPPDRGRGGPKLDDRAEGRVGRPVLASGNPRAELMFVGSTARGGGSRRESPFEGPAGALLTKIIEAIGLRRVDVRLVGLSVPVGSAQPLPPGDVNGGATLGSEIDSVRPKLIVALGLDAARALLGDGGEMGSLRGVWHTASGVPVRVTHPPDLLLRDVSFKRPTWEDMKVVRDRLAELRSGS